MTDASRTALIFGISGRDGAYLANSLLKKGYVVQGTSRDAEIAGFVSLGQLGIRDRVHLHSASPTDFCSVFQVVSCTSPHEIYNLSGQSSVGLSYRLIRFYNAGSGERFGDANRAATQLGWKAASFMPNVVARMIMAEGVELKSVRGPSV